MAKTYSNLCAIYGTRGDLDGAEEMQLKALALNEGLGRKEGMAIGYGNLGNIYRIRGDVPRAREHYEKALALFEQIGARPQIEQTRANLAGLGN